MTPSGARTNVSVRVGTQSVAVPVLSNKGTSKESLVSVHRGGGQHQQQLLVLRKII